MRALALLFLMAVFAFAEIKTFTQSVTQVIGDSQSTDDARKEAIKKAQANALREAGEFIVTQTTLKNNQLTGDEVEAISASIVKTTVKYQKKYLCGDNICWDITIESQIDSASISEQVEKILKHRETQAKLEQAEQDKQELSSENKRLEQEKLELQQKIKQLMSQSAQGNEPISQKTASSLQQDIASFTQMIRRDPNNVLAYIARGLSYGRLGDYSTAITDYNKAIELDTNEVRAYYNRGIAYQYLGNHSRAIADLTRAIQLAPELDLAYTGRAISYSMLDNHTKAIADLTQAIKLNPYNAMNYIVRGSSYDTLDDYTKAIDDYTQAIKINPNLTDAYTDRGITYKRMGKFAMAITDFSRAIQIIPNNKRAYFWRWATYYNDLGNIQMAAQDARKSCDIGDCEPLQIMNNNGDIHD
ncbi:hypothetical protein FACS1894103_3040 [Campylobacterota bacterium]|nr:hypothetical protein FACS1894103_3040 [Campylobacterota bacterium]